LFNATAGSVPLKIRGNDGPRAMARNADFFAGRGSACKQRLSQPSSVALTPGVPDSM
jgi:hypothetical protein